MLQTINNAGRASLARCAVIDVSGGCWYQVYPHPESLCWSRLTKKRTRKNFQISFVLLAWLFNCTELITSPALWGLKYQTHKPLFLVLQFRLELRRKIICISAVLCLLLPKLSLAEKLPRVKHLSWSISRFLSSCQCKYLVCSSLPWQHRLSCNHHRPAAPGNRSLLPTRYQPTEYLKKYNSKYG